MSHICEFEDAIYAMPCIIYCLATCIFFEKDGKLINQLQYRVSQKTVHTYILFKKSYNKNYKIDLKDYNSIVWLRGELKNPFVHKIGHDASSSTRKRIKNQVEVSVGQ